MNVRKAVRSRSLDDDPRILESLVNLLASFGYKAESYKSAEQFLGSGTLSRTSCIVTDVEMRQMSGLGLLQYLKNSNCTPPRNHHYEKAVGTVGGVLSGERCCGFFRKPVDGDALVELIGSVGV
jgi:DNA-binding NtrC family response regulator